MRIRQLDGIRALAVLMVFAEHGFSLPMGWAGVDLFFVLSGYLITTILRHDRDDPAYWRRFYIKRATRIIPALALCLVLCALLFNLGLHKLWLAYIFFGANFAAAFFPTHAPVEVLWSLAVEEHFYLFWPFAVSFLNRRKLIRLLLTILLLEPVIRGIATPFFQSYWTIYFLTPFRLDGLAAGSLLALLLENEYAKARIRALSGSVFLISTGTLALSCALIRSFKRPSNSLAFNSVGYTLVTIVAASLISYILLKGSTFVARVLAWRPISGIGQISYGIYLFQLIAFAFVSRAFHVPGHSRIGTWLSLAVAIAFSWLSFKFYETPWVKWGHKLASRWAAPKVAAA